MRERETARCPRLLSDDPRGERLVHRVEHCILGEFCERFYHGQAEPATDHCSEGQKPARSLAQPSETTVNQLTDAFGQPEIRKSDCLFRGVKPREPTRFVEMSQHLRREQWVPFGVLRHEGRQPGWRVPSDQ
jgi:hypothetical protein